MLQVPSVDNRTMNSYDVIVIGVGGWGSAVLWQLAGQRIIAVRIPPHRCTGTMLRSGVLPIVPPPHMDRGLSSQDARFSPSSDWRDPRLEPDFVAGCFPLCEGKDSPPVGTEDLKDRRKLEFVAAYYRINCAYERRAAASENDRRTAVVALNSQLSARDELEDRYAPIGFLAEPRLQGVQTVDLTFMHAPETPPPTPD